MINGYKLPHLMSFGQTDYKVFSRLDVQRADAEEKPRRSTTWLAGTYIHRVT